MDKLTALQSLYDAVQDIGITEICVRADDATESNQEDFRVTLPTAAAIRLVKAHNDCHDAGVIYEDGK